MFERIAVVGTGLIGGSILRRLHESGTDVVGVDPDPDAAETARRLDLPFTDDQDAAVAGRDLVVCAAPLAVIAAGLPRIADAMAADGLVTDVGSTKADVARAARPLGARFVGGHPMAGTENSGLAASDPALFDGAAWVLCPPSDVDVSAFRRLVRLVTDVLGARVVVVDPERHDETVALSSHIPHVLAAALAGAAGRSSVMDTVLALAAGSFRDGTRVAGTRPERTVDMLLHNRPSVVDQWGAVQGLMDAIVAAVRDDDRDALLDLFSGAAELRGALVRHEPTSSRRSFADGSSAELDFLFSLGREGGSVVACEPVAGGVEYRVLTRLPFDVVPAVGGAGRRAAVRAVPVGPTWTTCRVAFGLYRPGVARGAVVEFAADGVDAASRPPATTSHHAP